MLDQFAEVKEFENLADTVGEMLATQEERKNEDTKIAELHKQRINEEVDKAGVKYGRLMTPKAKERAAADSKRAGI